MGDVTVSVPFPSRATIHDLPSEVLSEIASHTDFVDIIALQQTCRKIRESTDTHVVWLGLAKEYSARHFHHYLPETGALDSLKTSELRAWIRKRLVVDEIWRAYTAQPRFRDIHETSDIVFKLVPGGRWLLVGHEYGIFRYYDLNSENLEPITLIPQSHDVPGSFHNIHEPVVHRDEGVSRLEFKLAMHATDTDSLTGATRGWTHIWQVRSEHGNSLTAEWLTSVPCGPIFPGALSLERHLMARTMIPIFGSSWIEIFRWNRYFGNGTPRTVLPLEDESSSISLIGDDRILCVGAMGVVKLYRFLEPEYVGVEGMEFQIDVDNHEPLWSHSFSSGGVMYSSPVSHQGAAHRLVMSTNCGILGFFFPESRKDLPLVVQLSKFSDGRSICPGICKAYVFGGEYKLGVRVGYSWDDASQPGMRFSNGRKDIASFDDVKLALDEEGGRIVYLVRDNIVVVDFLHQLGIFF